MSSPLPPVPSPAAGLPLPAAAPVSMPVPGPAAGAPVAPQAPSAAAAPASPASSASPSVPVTPPAATAVRWSPEMLQSLRLQAFEQLVAQLARQVQSSPGAPAPQWPASGVSEALGRLLEALLAQVGTQQGQALQLLAAQPGSAALLQALAAGTTAGTATGTAATGGQTQPSQSPQTAASASAQAGAAPQAASSSPALQAAASLQPSAAAVTLAVAAAKAKVMDALLAGSGLAPQAGASAPGGVAGGATQTLPALQSWWVQQGTLLTPQGERGFTLSLQVPQAWAQAQGAAMALAAASASAPGAAPFTAAALPAGAALPLAGAQATEPGLRLPLDASLQSLASGPVAVVLQPRGADALRTSALLLLELQPLRQPGGAMASPAGLASVASLASLSPALAQEVQQMLQQRNDPWLHMAAAQASGALPRERRAFEHQSHFCTTEGCQYEGRAPCAQPFCSEMNRLWDVSRTERSR